VSTEASCAPNLARYESILAHAELELELAGRGALGELDGLQRRWDELVADLPARAPEDAAPVLARARLVHERTRVELARVRDALLHDVAVAGRAKRTASGYAGPEQHAPALDRSA
jgi:hypothetical protein